jgi:hypothetical protein
LGDLLDLFGDFDFEQVLDIFGQFFSELSSENLFFSLVEEEFEDLQKLVFGDDFSALLRLLLGLNDFEELLVVVQTYPEEVFLFCLLQRRAFDSTEEIKRVQLQNWRTLDRFQ